MQVTLKVENGSYEGRMITVSPGQIVKVGRTDWADFALPDDARMSSVHFALECEPDKCGIRDLESTNGTFINGEKAFHCQLNSGDSVLAGHTEFSVTIEAARSSLPDLADQFPKPSAESLEASPLVTVPVQPMPFPPALMATADTDTPFVDGLMDDDASVRYEALMAALWTRQEWLLEFCRGMAASPSLEYWDAHWLLAVIGQPSDLERVLTICRSKQLGMQRFDIYAAFGHPRLIRDLLVGIESDDLNIAVNSGLAFTKITGAEIDSEERVTLPPEDGSEPDEFEKEFLDEAFLPSAELANKYWRENKERYATGTRWRRGINLTGEITPEILDQLDMESRWQACLRGKYHGTWNGSRMDLERFPHAGSRV